jgi:hypothetical protein
MRHHSPLRIQRLAKEEEAGLARQVHSKEKLEVEQTIKKKHIMRQMDEVEETIDYLSGFKSLQNRNRLPQISRAKLLDEYSPTNNSTTSRKEVASYHNLNSLASFDIHPNSRSQNSSMKSPNQDISGTSARFTHLIKSCYQNQLSFIRSPSKTPKGRTKPLAAGLQQAADEGQHYEDEKDKEVLETLLTRGYGAQKIDPCNNKYSKKQNKFVSYRRYRENYLAVKGNILTVLESDEK